MHGCSRLTAATAGLDLLEKSDHLVLDQGRIAAFSVDLLFNSFIRLISNKTHDEIDVFFFCSSTLRLLVLAVLKTRGKQTVAEA